MVSAINPVGPAAQPQKFAVAISDPGNGRQGIISIVDFSGDSLVANANVAPAPAYFALDGGSIGYVLHRSGATGSAALMNNELVDTFPISASLMTNQVTQASLLTGSNPTSVFPGASPSAVFITEPGSSRVAALTSGQPPTLRQELRVPANPVYTVGRSASARVYVLSQGATPGVCSTASTGTATAIENGPSQTISNSIAVGCNPIYGVTSADTRRAFVLNQGGSPASAGNGTVSIVNTQSNILDTNTLIPGGTVTVGRNPVWADIADSINELAVVNQGDGVRSGSLSIISIPLCNPTALVSNSSCDPNNPSDAAGFGTVLGTVPTGIKPVQVAVLQDLNKAYIANSLPDSSGMSTVTVVDLTTMIVVKTIPVGGTLNWIAATSGTPTGKVYVTASDTQNLTIIRTDTDQVITSIPLQGAGVAVRVTQP